MSLQQPGVLSQDVGVIYVQFSFSNPNAVPRPLRKLSDESSEKHEARKSSDWQSVPFIQPTDRVQAKSLLRDLESAGYVLVDACVQRRLGGQKGKWYSMVRYVFARKDRTRDLLPEFIRIRERARINLIRLLSDAFWRQRAYHNLTGEGSPIVGEWISINFEHRTPIVGGDGRVVTEWKKDEAGERVGDAPVPIQPTHVAGVWSGAVTLIPYRSEVLQSA